MDYMFFIKITVRLALAVIVGALIGSERARHGRAAGMRTHILVCLGATLTAIIGVFSNDYLGNSGDITRLSAQVISGIGFLGAGMIILKSNNVITGLTTAAGVWATSVIGIALGFGFYTGAVLCTLLFLFSTFLFAKFEKRKKNAESIYVEIDDMYSTNRILNELKEKIGNDFSHQISKPKSLYQGNLGITLLAARNTDIDIDTILEIKGVVFVEEDE